jgi:hypothetical protein
VTRDELTALAARLREAAPDRATLPPSGEYALHALDAYLTVSDQHPDGLAAGLDHEHRRALELWHTLQDTSCAPSRRDAAAPRAHHPAVRPGR